MTSKVLPQSLYYIRVHLALVIATRKAFEITNLYKMIFVIGNVQ